MPVMDDSFQAFVTNLGKYNEGELVGEWVKFPTTEEEMQKVFERIGIGSKDEFGHVYEEWFITDYECPVHGVYDIFFSGYGGKFSGQHLFLFIRKHGFR